MNLVEKAAEKLKAQQPATPAAPLAEPAPPPGEVSPPSSAPTIERLMEHEPPIAEADTDASICHVDIEMLERWHLQPRDDGAKGRLDDELRRIKRPLLGNANNRGAKPLAHAQRIVVASAVPGEGKTFTAVNLALSLAREPDFEVLLVDADMPKSDITRAFGLEGRPGLMDVLEDDRRHPSEVVVATDIPDLMVVPAGKHHALAPELFGSLRMQHVLAGFDAGNRRRLVVFDSPPLLATPEAQVLASHMGQVVMVVAAGSTSEGDVASALRCLDGESQYVGLILNMSRIPTSENPYYKYYGYSGTGAGARQGDA